jgi:polyphosphate kinase
VGRFLEHSRIYYFHNGGEEAEEVYLGSADLMPRNLDRRVETLFPVEDATLKRVIVDDILPAYLKDNQKARMLLSDGTYDRVIPGSREAPFNVQDYFLSHHSEAETRLHALEV